MKNIVLVTGGFDPLHSGHIAYFRDARALGDQLVVGVNSDAWLARKKGRAFMPFVERSQIIKNLRMVDHVIEYDDNDGSSKNAIYQVREMFPNAHIIFANGGDREAVNIPEMDATDPSLEFRFGVGGRDKANSSSWILEEWKAPRTRRPWGYYRVLHENGPSVKVKELTVEPGTCLSMQRHGKRYEHWFVAEGTATVYTLDGSEPVVVGYFRQFQHLHIDRMQWHRLCNETDHALKIIEIQYGEQCEESDIERQT